MAKRKNDTEFTVEDAQLALEKLESKLEELTDVIEEKLVNNKTSGPQRAPKTKVKVVSMPSDDIEVDMSDPYNTQPKNSVTHNYLKNHRMFRKDALRNVIKSKMFWIMLILLPVIFTIIEYIFTGWFQITGNYLVENGPTKVSLDLINWFMITPLLLMSLIIFPTFIAMSRENNQLKRYSMNGMSRKQIYWSYIRFSIGFLTLMFVFWMLIWVNFLNVIVDSIWLSEEQLINGEHVFSNPWGIFFGMNFNMTRFVNSIDANQLTWQINMIIVSGMEDSSIATFINGIESGAIDIKTWYSTEYVVNKFFAGLDAAGGDYFAIEEYLLGIQSWFNDQLGVEFYFKDIEKAIMNIKGATFDVETGLIKFKSIALSVPVVHEGIDTELFFGLFVLIMFGMNSVGFNKAMKVSSSRSLMGWGIGLWLFASVVQGTSGLLYNDIYRFDSIDKKFWNYFVMVLLFILKWMFIFSPITIMMVGISLTTGWIVEPDVIVLGEGANAFLDWAIANQDILTPGGPIYSMAILLNAVRMNEYNPLIKPEIITTIFISISALWAIIWTSKVWMFKSRIVSYEAAR